MGGDYVMQVAEQELLKGQEKRGGGSGSNISDASQNTGATKSDDMVHSQRMGNALKKIERMLNQNVDDEIFQDFKYWDDTSDAFRDGEGSLFLCGASTLSDQNASRSLLWPGIQSILTCFQLAMDLTT